MSKKRARYTDDFRASVVLMLTAAGYTGDPETSKKGSLNKVATHVGVPDRTISRWFKKENNPPPDIVVNTKRGDLVDRLRELSHLIVDELMKPDRIQEATYRELVTAQGVTIDKLQLLSGEATERTQNLNVNVDGGITSFSENR